MNPPVHSSSKIDRLLVAAVNRLVARATRSSTTVKPALHSVNVESAARAARAISHGLTKRQRSERARNAVMARWAKVKRRSAIARQNVMKRWAKASATAPKPKPTAKLTWKGRHADPARWVKAAAS